MQVQTWINKGIQKAELVVRLTISTISTMTADHSSYQSGVIDDDGWTSLQIAARRGHDRVVELLLAQDPHAASAVGPGGWTALHLAAVGGYDRVVDLLLARSPELMNARIHDGRTALHLAARGGHERMVNLLLASISKQAKEQESKQDKRDMVAAVDNHGLTALHLAAGKGHERIAERLLALRPELVQVVDSASNTILHEACKRCSRGFVEKVFDMHQPALRVLNSSLQSPFGVAVIHGNEAAQELLQWHLSFDQLRAAFVCCKRSPDDKITSLRELVEQPLSMSLHRDVVGTVWRYV